MQGSGGQRGLREAARGSGNAFVALLSFGAGLATRTKSKHGATGQFACAWAARDASAGGSVEGVKGSVVSAGIRIRTPYASQRRPWLLAEPPGCAGHGSRRCSLALLEPSWQGRARVRRVVSRRHGRAPRCPCKLPLFSSYRVQQADVDWLSARASHTSPRRRTAERRQTPPDARRVARQSKAIKGRQDKWNARTWSGWTWPSRPQPGDSQRRRRQRPPHGKKGLPWARRLAPSLPRACWTVTLPAATPRPGRLATTSPLSSTSSTTRRCRTTRCRCPTAPPNAAAGPGSRRWAAPADPAARLGRVRHHHRRPPAHRHLHPAQGLPAGSRAAVAAPRESPAGPFQRER